MCENSKFAVWHKKENFYLVPPCKKWCCSECSPNLKKSLEERFSQSEANKWKIKTHITLTVSGEYESSVIDEAFNDLLTYLRRGGAFTFITYSGKPKTVYLPPRPHLKYLWVKEIQPDRYLTSGKVVYHKHIVFNQYFSKYDIIPVWNHALKLQGSKADFNYVEATYPRNFNAGKYLVNSYLTKVENQDLFDKGERRYGSSRGVIPVKPVRIPSGEWEFMSLRKARLVLAWFNADSPRDKEHIAYDIGFDSRYDDPFGVIHRIAYGVK